MNEQKKKLIDEAINGIKEEYIDKTAEALFKNAPTEGQLTEIIVEKPPKDNKLKLKRTISVVMTSAASLGIIIGAGFLLKKYDIDTKNPSQSETSATTEESEIIPVYGDDIIAGAGFNEYDVHLYSRDGGKLSLQILSNKEITDNYDTEISYFEIGEVKPSLQGAELSGGDITILSVPRLKESGTGIEYMIYLFASTKDSLTPIKDANGELLSFTSSADRCITDAPRNAVQAAFDYGETRKTYFIYFDSYTAVNAAVSPVDQNLTAVDVESLEFIESDNGELFTGRWIRDFGGTDNEHYPFILSEMDTTAETEDGYFRYYVEGGEPQILFIPKAETNFMFSYPHILGGECKLSNYSIMYKRSDNEGPFENYAYADFAEYSVRLSYETSTFSECTKLEIVDPLDTSFAVFEKEIDITAELINNQEPIFTGASANGGNIVMITVPVPSETDMGQYKTYLYECTPNSIEEISVVSLSGEPAELISVWEPTLYEGHESVLGCPNYGKADSRYLINLEANTATETHLYPIDGNEEEINLDYDSVPFGEADNSIFEDIFYGEWTVEFVASPICSYFIDEELSFSYNGDSSGSAWSSFQRTPYETEDGYYFEGINAGEGTLLYIEKDNPDCMYYYERPFECSKNQYYCVFRRKAEASSYDKEFKAGPISVYGLGKLETDYGFDLSIIPEIVTDDEGEEWKSWAHMGYMGAGQTYLKTLSENEINFSRLYCPSDYDIGSYDFTGEAPMLRYLSFKAVRNAGGWEIAEVAAYDRELESSDKEMTPLKESVIFARDVMNLSADYIENGELHDIIYFPRSDGTYYACRFVSDDGGNSIYSEYYYNNGTCWSYLGGADSHNFPAVSDDIFCYAFDFYPDDTNYIYLWDGNNLEDIYRTKYQKGANWVRTNKYADYTLIEVEYLQGDTDYYLRQNNLFGTDIGKIDSLTPDEDAEGFNVQIDYTTYRYRPDSADIDDHLWHLANGAKTVWNSCMNGTSLENKLDLNRSITAEDGSVLYYFCEYSELYNYLAEIYTDECVEEIINRAGVDFTAIGTAVYINTDTGPIQWIGKIGWEVLTETDDSAEVMFIVYPWDLENNEIKENPCGVYSVEVIKTEYGWRINDFILKNCTYDAEKDIPAENFARALTFLNDLDSKAIPAVSYIVLEHINDEDFWNNDNTYLHPTEAAVLKFVAEAAGDTNVLADEQLVYYECQNGYWNNFEFDE